MLWAIVSILLVFWILGLSFHVLGNYIHLLFLLAIAAILIRYIRGSAA